jgi:Zn-dependent membrane protease YugP
MLPFADPYHLLLVAPAIAFSGFISMQFSSTLKKYSGVANKKGLTGRDTVAHMLKLNNINDVPIQQVAGAWSDHYGRGKSKDGTELKWISLSEPVFDKTTISAVAVAAHEAGHAIQYATKYKMMGLRNFIRPFSNIGSQFGPYAAMAGIALGFGPLIDLGIFLFAGAVLFSLLTLPAELNASARALAILRANEMLTKEELAGAKKALNAAAMTYFAGLLTNCASFIRLLLLRKKKKR